MPNDSLFSSSSFGGKAAAVAAEKRKLENNNGMNANHHRQAHHQNVSEGDHRWSAAEDAASTPSPPLPPNHSRDAPHHQHPQPHQAPDATHPTPNHNGPMGHPPPRQPATYHTAPAHAYPQPHSYPQPPPYPQPSYPPPTYEHQRQPQPYFLPNPNPQQQQRTQQTQNKTGRRSQPDHVHTLKTTLRSRDDEIQRLRKDVRALQVTRELQREQLESKDKELSQLTIKLRGVEADLESRKRLCQRLLKRALAAEKQRAQPGEMSVVTSTTTKTAPSAAVTDATIKTAPSGMADASTTTATSRTVDASTTNTTTKLDMGSGQEQTNKPASMEPTVAAQREGEHVSSSTEPKPKDASDTDPEEEDWEEEGTRHARRRKQAEEEWKPEWELEPTALPTEKTEVRASPRKHTSPKRFVSEPAHCHYRKRQKIVAPKMETSATNNVSGSAATQRGPTDVHPGATPSQGVGRPQEESYINASVAEPKEVVLAKPKEESVTTTNQPQSLLDNSKPKYSVGTEVLKSFPGYGEFRGKVVDFDGDYYKILYEDGDKEDLEEAEIDQLKVIEALLTTNPKE